MTLTPGLRKLALTAHVTASVGWLGAVAGSLALAVYGLAGDDARTASSAYVALELLARYVLVPLSFASLLSGLASSLASPWGVFRHYWVVAKLVINVLATVILLMYLQTLDHLAGLASQALSSGNPPAVRSASPVLHAAGGLLLLLVATVLGLYKPRGLTRYGWRKQQERRATPALQR